MARWCWILDAGAFMISSGLLQPNQLLTVTVGWQLHQEHRSPPVIGACYPSWPKHNMTKVGPWHVAAAKAQTKVPDTTALQQHSPARSDDSQNLQRFAAYKLLLLLICFPASSTLDQFWIVASLETAVFSVHLLWAINQSVWQHIISAYITLKNYH